MCSSTRQQRLLDVELKSTPDILTAFNGNWNGSKYAHWTEFFELTYHHLFEFGFFRAVR
jgi:hypothetical protein